MQAFRRLFFLILIATGAFFHSAYAQLYTPIYRPPGLQWQQLTTDHFRIIFPDGEDSTAWQTARILENQYPRAQQLISGEVDNLPVILNNYNDRSNGYVSPYNFRIEVEVPSIKGKSQNPRSGTWLETVMPHELIHALNASINPGFGFTEVVSWFSPDAARATNLMVPSGIVEGIAVEYETTASHLDAGRGDYPYFFNQFNSVLSGDDPWSMGQLTSTTITTHPINRHYIGGHEFIDWLHDTYGDTTTADMFGRHARWPLFGYGWSAWRETGQWPGQLYDAFQQDRTNQEQARQNIIGKPTPARTIELPFKGEQIHRPKWLSEDKLIFYGSFYNARPGFYSYDLSTGSTQLLVETSSVENYQYVLGSNQSLLFARYNPHPIYDNYATADLYRADLSTGDITRQTQRDRLHSPVSLTADTIWALKNNHYSTRLVEVSPGQSDSLRSILSPPLSTEIVQIVPNPANPDKLAIVANRDGEQALWITDRNQLPAVFDRPPTIKMNGGSVFDPAWHPDGEKLLFSANDEKVHNVFLYKTSEDSVYRLTNSLYNAYEPSFSPDGNSIAFVKQTGNEQKIAMLQQQQFYNVPLPGIMWKPTNIAEAVGSGGFNHSYDLETTSWKQSRYRDPSWIKPRMVLPTMDHNFDELGVYVTSVDPLRRHQYSAQLTYGYNQVWYDFTYRNKSFYPGFEVSLYNDPFHAYLLIGDRYEELLWHDRGIEFSVPIPITLERNVRSTTFTLTPSYRFRQRRVFEEVDRIQPGYRFPFTNVHTVNVRGRLNYRLQQNFRDLQPNTGLILFADMEQDLASNPTETDRPHLDFSQRQAFRGGVQAFVSPFRRFNQSLRLGAEYLTQNRGAIFDTEQLISDGFSDNPLLGLTDMMTFSTRYTIPIAYPDNGGFLIPAYLGNVYLAAFSNTAANLDVSGTSQIIEQSRTVFGLGVRAQFRFSSLLFELGIAVGYEATRDNWNAFIGNF